MVKFFPRWEFAVSAAIGRFQGQIGTFRGWLADAPCYRCFVGDAFDLVWRSNSKNLRIIKKYLDKHHPATRIIEA